MLLGEKKRDNLDGEKDIQQFTASPIFWIFKLTFPLNKIMIYLFIIIHFNILTTTMLFPPIN